MIERIISGGQTGADRAALDAAMACGVPHGGWCPKGRMAEDGPIAPLYHLKETFSSGYIERTRKNVKISEGTVIFTMGELTSGSARTAEFATGYRKPWIHVVLGGDPEAAVTEVRDFLGRYDVRQLNVAGPRASGVPEIYGAVRQVMMLLLGAAHRAD